MQFAALGYLRFSAAVRSVRGMRNPCTHEHVGPLEGSVRWFDVLILRCNMLRKFTICKARVTMTPFQHLGKQQASSETYRLDRVSWNWIRMKAAFIILSKFGSCSFRSRAGFSCQSLNCFACTPSAFTNMIFSTLWCSYILPPFFPLFLDRMVVSCTSDIHTWFCRSWIRTFLWECWGRGIFQPVFVQKRCTFEGSQL